MKIKLNPQTGVSSKDVRLKSSIKLMSKPPGQPWMPSPGLLFSPRNNVEPGDSPLGKSLPLETSQGQHSAPAGASLWLCTATCLPEPQFPHLYKGVLVKATTIHERPQTAPGLGSVLISESLPSDSVWTFPFGLSQSFPRPAAWLHSGLFLEVLSV